MAVHPDIWPAPASISKSAAIPIALHGTSDSGLPTTISPLQAAWDVTIGSYEHVPSLRFNGVATSRLIVPDQETSPLLALEAALMLIPDSNFRRAVAIVASGEQTVVKAGPQPEVWATAILNLAATYWRGQIMSIPTSSAAGAGVYATLAEVGVAMNKTYYDSGVHAALTAVADPVLLTDASGAHEGFIYILRDLFKHRPSKLAISYLYAIRTALLASAISSCEYDGEAEEFLITVTQDFAGFYLAHREALAEMAAFETELVEAWLVDCEVTGKFIELNGIRLQHVDPESAFARWFKSTTRTLHLVCADNPELDVTVEQDNGDRTEMDSTDITSEPDIAAEASDGNNNRLWHPTAPSTEIAGCCNLEGSASPLAYAAESGVLSQCSYGAEFRSLKKYPALSEKARSKTYKMEDVTPNIQDSVLRAQYAVKIARLVPESLTSRWVEWRQKAWQDWWSDQYDSLIAPFLLSPADYSYDVDGTSYLVQRDHITLPSLPQLVDLDDADHSLATNWVLAAGIGSEFWKHIVAPQLSSGIICIPTADLREDYSVPTSVGTYNTFAIASVKTQEAAVLCTLKALADLAGVEWRHCVDAYKQRAQDYNVIPGIEGGGSHQPNYWILLLELIPLTILIIAIAADDGGQS